MNILKDKYGDTSKLSLSRLTSFCVTITLTVGFILSTYKGMIQWETFISYPIGVTVAYAPQLFIRLLTIYKS